MSPLIALLTGAFPPPPLPGAGRMVMPLSVHKVGEELIELWVCTTCGEEFDAEGFYWRQRKHGQVHRLSWCKACHIKQVAKYERARAAKKRAALEGKTCE